jgi:hypothetical protein
MPHSVSRRSLLRTTAAALALRPFRSFAAPVKVFDVAKFGAKGDGTTLDSAAFQHAIDAAAASGTRAQVLVRGGKKYVVGTLVLKGPIDFHLADDAELLASLRREDYLGSIAGTADADSMASAAGAIIVAQGVQGLTISGTGKLNGRARDWMTGYDPVHEWWLPKDWRPKMFVLTACTDLQVRDITFAEAPNWGLHMLGCERVLVDRVKVRNLLDVPNCDGIDPDHSRHVEIRNCDIVAGDDAIVVKCSRQTRNYGPSSHIHVHDCVLETQDAGLKIGTETTSDIHDVLFERCKVKTSSRGLGIQLRDKGNVSNITFKDIDFLARFYSDPWWGRGEAISLTAIPRTAGAKIGRMHHITIQNVTGRAENSVRIWGSPESRIEDVLLDRVDVTLDRWTKYPGNVYDNRPSPEAVVPHETAGFSFRDADRIQMRDCKLTWKSNAKQIDAEKTTALENSNFKVTSL